MGLIQEILEIVRRRNPNEPEFLQAVTEVLESIEPAVQRQKNIGTRRFSTAWSSLNAR
jgi:glutamate dehydrogenase (NADP+)